MKVIATDWKQVDKLFFTEYYNIGLIKRTENWSTEEFNEWCFKQYLKNDCVHESLDSTNELQELVIQELEQYEVQCLFNKLDVKLTTTCNTATDNYFKQNGFELITINKFHSKYLHVQSKTVYYRLSDHLFNDDYFNKGWLNTILKYSVPIFKQDGTLYEVMIEEYVLCILDGLRIQSIA